MNVTQENALALKAAGDAALAAMDNADPTKVSASLSAYGSIVWAPVRAPDFDASAWGDWEAWEHCREGFLPDGSVGAIPSGQWIAWNASTGAQLGYPEPNSRRKAEMTAVLWNDGKPTRLVERDGTAIASALVYADVAAQVEAAEG